MPSKQAKQRKLDRKTANKTLKVGKTDKARKQRLANKAKRDEIHAINPDIKITIVNGVTANNYGEELKVVDGEVIIIPNTIDNDDIPIDGDAADYGLPEDVHSGAEELARYATGETVAVEPESAGMWDKLKNKWEKV